jgi:hypothetical protein
LLLTILVLILQDTYCVIIDLETFEKDGAKIIFASDFHVPHEHAKAQSLNLKKIIANTFSFLIVEDPSIVNCREIPKNFNKEEMLKKIKKRKENRKSLSFLPSEMMNFALELYSIKGQRDIISIDTHRKLYLENLYDDDRSSSVSILNLHKDIVSQMNSDYCRAYKKLYKEELDKKITVENPFHQRYLGNFLIELKMLQAIEAAIINKHKIIFIWAGGYHIDKVKNVLTQKFSFNIAKKDPLYDNSERFYDVISSDEDFFNREKINLRCNSLSIPNISEFLNSSGLLPQKLIAEPINELRIKERPIGLFKINKIKKVSRDRVFNWLITSPIEEIKIKLRSKTH